MTLYQFEDRQPECDDTAWLAPNAHVIGDVVLDEDVSIWFGAVLRGDNERIHIGARSNIQENAVLHTDMGYPLKIAEDCTIGHLAMLHGCTIDQGALVGMQAVVMNGAHIGAGSLVAAGALVAEGTVIPPGVLVVGTPARVVRELDKKARDKLRQSATEYMQKAKRFRQSLRAL